jgi:4-oxalocrotonate tautomerase family enzyme
VPIVQISMLQGRSTEQKVRLAEVIGEALITIAGAQSSNIEILFMEYDAANWLKLGPKGVRPADSNRPAEWNARQ